MFKNYKNVYSYTWTIENFSFCHHRTGSSLYCSFIDKNVSERLWRLDIFPRGYKQESSAFISCVLRNFSDSIADLEDFANLGTDVECGFKIEIIGASGKKLRTHEETIAQPVWLCRKFLEIQRVVQEAENSENDTLTVLCHVYGNNSDKQANDKDAWRSKMLIDRLHCSWEKNIIVEKILQENFVFPKSAEFKVVLTMLGDFLKINIIKVNSKSFTDHIVECKLSLLACDVYDESRKAIDYLCTQKATHFFKSKHFSRPETWEFPSDIISYKLNEHISSVIGCKTSFSYRLFCEFLCSNGLEQVLPVTVTNTDTVVKKHPTLKDDLQQMFLTKKHCDIKLRVDNQVIEAHKNVLTARSPVFSTMFEQNMTEACTGIIDIVDIDVKTMYLLLEFLYTDTVNGLDVEQAKSLILAAEKYQVLSLKEKCADILYSEMSVENMCDILVLADTVADVELKSAAIEFMEANVDKVKTYTDWELWKETHPKLTAEVRAKFKAIFSSTKMSESVEFINDLIT